MPLVDETSLRWLYLFIASRRKTSLLLSKLLVWGPLWNIGCAMWRTFKTSNLKKSIYLYRTCRMRTTLKDTRYTHLDKIHTHIPGTCTKTLRFIKNKLNFGLLRTHAHVLFILHVHFYFFEKKLKTPTQVS